MTGPLYAKSFLLLGGALEVMDKTKQLCTSRIHSYKIHDSLIHQEGAKLGWHGVCALVDFS